MVGVWAMVVTLAALPVPSLVKTPSWVKTVEVSRDAAPSTGAVRMLLADSQIRVGKTVERHRHLAWKVLSQAGIQQVARQQLDWDPSWQQLDLNGVWVWRNGVRRDAWKPEDARVIQREEGLNEGLYDGRLSLLIELRDVREGDIVEIASTRRGENPVYKGRFTHEEWLLWGSDLARSHFRLTWERERPLRLKVHGGAQAPSETRSGNAVVYAWDSESWCRLPSRAAFRTISSRARGWSSPTGKAGARSPPGEAAVPLQAMSVGPRLARAGTR